MRHVMVGALVGVLALGLAAGAWSQAVPWKAGADKPAAATEVQSEGAAPAAAPDAAKLEKVAAPVKEALAQIEKAQKTLDDEMSKPNEKRDAKKILGLREGIARMYLTAAQKAKVQSQSALLSKPEERQALLDQYEKPNREKAISLLMELANESLSKNDFAGAEARVRQILVIDPKNAEALELLKKIAEAKVAAAKAAKQGGAGSGDSLKDKNLDPNLRDWSRTGRGADTDYGRTGRTW
ncbi:MAG: hypothetical protein FJ288_05580 [Planctomycetes bacterium]|nr:hypothetical protein [Planctomycetota bacterium]